MESNVETVLVATDTSGITTNATALATFLSAGNVGELAIFNADTHVTVQGATVALPSRHYYAVKTSATELRKSPTFNSCPSYMISGASAAGVAEINQISNFSGDCETEYIIKVRLESEKIFQTYGYQDLIKTYSYVSRCCGNACGCPDGASWDVAMGIAEAVNLDNENRAQNATEYMLGFARVFQSNTELTVTDYDNTQNWTFTKGSNVIVCTTNVNYGASTPTVAGDFVGALPAGLGTFTSAAGDYFRVESVSGLNITLDRPWPYDSFVAAGGGSDLQVLPKAVGEGYDDSAWTIEIAGGLHATPAVGSFATFAGIQNNNLISASIGLIGAFDCNGTVATTTAATLPQGQDWQVSQLELANSKNAIGSGNRPSPYRTPFPLTNLGTGESSVVSGQGYYVISVIYRDQHLSADTASAVRSPMVVQLVIDDGAATTYTDVAAAFATGWNGIAINADGVVPVQ